MRLSVFLGLADQFVSGSKRELYLGRRLESKDFWLCISMEATLKHPSFGTIKSPRKDFVWLGSLAPWAGSARHRRLRTRSDRTSDQNRPCSKHERHHTRRNR